MASLLWLDFMGEDHAVSIPLDTMLEPIDSRKLKRELGWQPSLQFEEGIEKTVRWYLQNQKWMDDITSGEYQEYYQSMYKDR